MPVDPSGDRGPARDGYRIELLSESQTVRPDDVIALWVDEGVVPEEEANRRIHEVLMVGVHETRGVAAVSSAFLQRNAQLRMDFWYYRAFTASAHRSSNVANAMWSRAVEHLTERHRSGVDRRSSGVVVEVENAELRRQFTVATNPPGPMVFIGENERGAHVRVLFFPGATVPTPAL